MYMYETNSDSILHYHSVIKGMSQPTDECTFQFINDSLTCMTIHDNKTGFVKLRFKNRVHSFPVVVQEKKKVTSCDFSASIIGFTEAEVF